jgi:hypothetical protein
MKTILRDALYNALSEFGEGQRMVIIFMLQRDYGIRFIDVEQPSLNEMEAALRDILGTYAENIIKKMEKELGPEVSRALRKRHDIAEKQIIE